MLIASHYVWHIKPEFDKWNTFRCWDICSKQLEDACIEIDIANEINVNIGTSEYFEDACIDIDVYIVIAMHCHSVILLRREFRLYNKEIRKDFGAGTQFLIILGWMSFCEALPQEEQYLVTLLPVGGLAQLAWTSRNSSTDGKNISVWKLIKRCFHIWSSDALIPAKL